MGGWIKPQIPWWGWSQALGLEPCGGMEDALELMLSTGVQDHRIIE